MAIRIMLVDNDLNHMDAVKQYFSSSSSISVVKTFENGEEALGHLTDDYDCLIVNYLLSGVDGLTILAKLKELNIKKEVIVTSEYISPDMMASLDIYKPEYVIKKPFNMSSLEDVILKLSNKSKESTSNDLKLEITNLLHSLGIPSHIKGYT